MSQSIHNGHFATPIDLQKQRGLCLHAIVFVRNGEFLSALSATCSQYSTAIGGSHSLTETVLVSSLSVRGLECSFHLTSIFLCYCFHCHPDTHRGFGLQN